MLISAKRLLRRGDRARKQTLSVLRQRLAHTQPFSPGLVALADEVRDLKRQIAVLSAAPESCRSCSLPDHSFGGTHPGGDCCAGETELIFSSADLALLRASGLSRAEWQIDNEPLTGCVFRSSMGCTIQPEARATVCLHYMCKTLMRELAADERLERVLELRGKLEECHERARVILGETSSSND